MNTALWVIICLCASVGLADAVGWVVCSLKKPPGLRSPYRVVLLENDPEKLEAQLRYALLQAQWNSRPGDRLVFCFDQEPQGEARRIFENLIWDLGRVTVCCVGELEEALRRMERQEATRV